MTKKHHEKQIIAIWAQAANGIIGKEMTMPWYLPAELRHFKETTMNQAILMGRVTFDGMKRRLLPGRQTLILTRDESFQVEGALTVTSVEEVLDWYHQQDKTLYIAGGAAIYQAFEPYYDRLIKTTIQAELEGDTVFPDLDLSAFEVVSEQMVLKDEKNAYDFSISILERRGAD